MVSAGESKPPTAGTAVLEDSSSIVDLGDEEELPPLSFDENVVADVGPTVPAVRKTLLMLDNARSAVIAFDADSYTWGADEDLPYEELAEIRTLTLTEGSMLGEAIGRLLDHGRGTVEDLIDRLPARLGAADEEVVRTALEQALSSAGLLPTDPIWNSIDPFRGDEEETNPTSHYSQELQGGEGDGVLLEIGQSCPDLGEIIAYIDDALADSEAIWWARAAKEHRRVSKVQREAMHRDLVAFQNNVSKALVAWISSLPAAVALRVWSYLQVKPDEVTDEDSRTNRQGDPARTGAQEAVGSGPALKGGGDQLRPAALAEHLSRVMRKDIDRWLPTLLRLPVAGLKRFGAIPPPELMDAVVRLHRQMCNLAQIHLPLVRHVLKAWRWSPVHPDDLIQQGNLGLWRALGSFDPEGSSFATYGAWWVMARMTRYIRLDRVVHPSSGMAERAHEWREAQEYLVRRGRPASWRDVAQWLELPPESLQENLALVEACDDVLPIDLLAADETEGPEYMDHTPTPEQATLTAEGVTRVHVSLGVLNERELRVIRMRFGLDGADPKKLEEIGEVFGLSRERIRQIEKKALEKLRGWLTNSEVAG